MVEKNKYRQKTFLMSEGILLFPIDLYHDFDSKRSGLVADLNKNNLKAGKFSGSITIEEAKTRFSEYYLENKDKFMILDATEQDILRIGSLAYYFYGSKLGKKLIKNSLSIINKEEYIGNRTASVFAIVIDNEYKNILADKAPSYSKNLVSATYSAVKLNLSQLFGKEEFKVSEMTDPLKMLQYLSFNYDKNLVDALESGLGTMLFFGYDVTTYGYTENKGDYHGGPEYPVWMDDSGNLFISKEGGSIKGKRRKVTNLELLNERLVKDTIKYFRVQGKTVDEEKVKKVVNKFFEYLANNESEITIQKAKRKGYNVTLTLNSMEIILGYMDDEIFQTMKTVLMQDWNLYYALNQPEKWIDNELNGTLKGKKSVFAGSNSIPQDAVLEYFGKSFETMDTKQKSLYVMAIVVCGYHAAKKLVEEKGIGWFGEVTEKELMKELDKKGVSFPGNKASAFIASREVFKSLAEQNVYTINSSTLDKSVNILSDYIEKAYPYDNIKNAPLLTFLKSFYDTKGKVDNERLREAIMLFASDLRINKGLPHIIGLSLMFSGATIENDYTFQQYIPHYEQVKKARGTKYRPELKTVGDYKISKYKGVKVVYNEDTEASSVFIQLYEKGNKPIHDGPIDMNVNGNLFLRLMGWDLSVENNELVDKEKPLAGGGMYESIGTLNIIVEKIDNDGNAIEQVDNKEMVVTRKNIDKQHNVLFDISKYEDGDYRIRIIGSRPDIKNPDELVFYFNVKRGVKPIPMFPRMLASVPNLRETSVKATPVSEVNIGGTFAPGYAGYIDLNRISNDLPNVFHDDGSVDGGLLYDIYNSQGYISDFIKPGHDEWQNRQTWVNNVRTIDDFLKYVFGVVDVNYNPNTGEYSLVQDESEAIVRNDGDSYNGILRRGISYQFKLGEGETIRFVRGTTLDLFSGIVVGFDDKDRLRRALASGKFSLYKLTVDANIVPVDLSWHEEPGLERASNISVLNVNGNMVIQGQEDIPLEESSERGFMGTVGLGMGATFKGFILDAYSSAAVGVVGTRISMPGVRAKARLIGPQLLVLPIGISPSAVVSYDFTTKEWVVEGGVYASVKSAIVSGEAGIGPMKLVAGGYREADKTVRIGVFVPLAKWLDIQGKIGIGGKHLSPDELEQRWGGMLKLKPTSWGDLTVSAQYDPFNKKIVYGIQVGVDVIKLFKLE